MNYDEIKRRATEEFLSDCGDDSSPEELWKLLWIIRYIINGDDYPTADADVADPAIVRQMTLEIVEELMRSRELEAWFTNYPVTDTYKLERASQSINNVMRRIEAEWNALGHEPSMCEIAAFSVPSNKQITNR